MSYKRKDGIVIDNTSGLQWQDEEPFMGTFEEAKEYAKNLRLGGYSDWRLPTIAELETLLLEGRVPTINPMFQYTTSLEYWSSTLVLEDSLVKCVDFYGGYGCSANENGSYYVRCVRNPQIAKSVLIKWVCEYYFQLPIQDNLFILWNKKIQNLAKVFNEKNIQVNDDSCITDSECITYFYSAFAPTKMLPKIFKVEIKGDSEKNGLNPKIFFSGVMSEKDKELIKSMVLNSPKEWVGNCQYTPFEFSEFDLNLDYSTENTMVKSPKQTAYKTSGSKYLKVTILYEDQWESLTDYIIQTNCGGKLGKHQEFWCDTENFFENIEEADELIQMIADGFRDTECETLAFCLE